MNALWQSDKRTVSVYDKNSVQFSSVQFSSVQFSSVQFKMVSMRSGKPICSPPRLSGVSPVLPLKQFQWRCLFHSSPLKEDRWELSLSTPVSSRCPQLVSQAPQHFRSSTSHLWSMLCQPVYLLCHFLWLRHVQDNTPTEFLEGGCRTLTHASLGFPFHFFHFL